MLGRTTFMKVGWLSSAVDLQCTIQSYKRKINIYDKLSLGKYNAIFNVYAPLEAHAPTSVTDGRTDRHVLFAAHFVLLASVRLHRFLLSRLLFDFERQFAHLQVLAANTA